MKKQFTKIKIAAENLSRSNKHDRKDFELETIEKQVEKYRDVLEKMVRKLPAVSTATDTQEREKRIKKNSHYKIGQALEESCKELNREMPLLHVLANCGELEKSLAECIVDSELETETEVVRRLKLILDNEIQEISTLKRNVSRTVQEYASLKRSYEAAIRLDEPQSKINSIKDQQEQCEIKLEKERDQWAAQMFELIAKEDVIVHCIRDYVLNQRNYHERALLKVNSSLASIQDVIQSTVKSRFGTSLHEHLESTQREISYIIELCVCCLVENGLYEEGLLRVGCANTKLRRMKHALEAQYVKTPLPLDYQDPHVIGSILKLYLRELPEPLLTYKYYKDFIHAAEGNSEAERKAEIKTTLAKLPKENYANLRYLTKFLWLVTQYVEQNKMTSQNLAIVMSPNMLWPRVDKSTPADYLGQVNSSSAVNVIVELLISQWDYFFDGEVDFFVTLQRNKLYAEGKTKSNSSNEHLDKNEDSHESPRYGTIRRQKPCAPSPPAKTNEKFQQIQTQNNGDAYYRNGEYQQNKKNGTILTNSNTSTPQSNHQAVNEKPEKPPLPKVLQFQQNSLTSSQMPPPPAVPQSTENATNNHNNNNNNSATPKPVPMTRTQFFGLDNLPSPVADRRSNDSLSNFKPDLPQKPKIPKRPVVLGLNAAGAAPRSDEETTPTQGQAQTQIQSQTQSGINLINNISTTTDNGTIKTHSRHNSTEKFLEHLRHENCDNNINNKTSSAMTSASGSSEAPSAVQPATTTTSAAPTTLLHSKENINSNLLSSQQNIQQLLTSEQNSNANLTHKRTFSNTSTNSNSNSNSNSSHSNAEKLTPTSPVSPSMLAGTPKRPTIPAPPPPSVVKKQNE